MKILLLLILFLSVGCTVETIEEPEEPECQGTTEHQAKRCSEFINTNCEDVEYLEFRSLEPEEVIEMVPPKECGIYETTFVTNEQLNTTVFLHRYIEVADRETNESWTYFIYQDGRVCFERYEVYYIPQNESCI